MNEEQLVTALTVAANDFVAKNSALKVAKKEREDAEQTLATKNDNEATAVTARESASAAIDDAVAALKAGVPA